MARMPDLDRLKSQLLTTGLQQKDFPLYQVIDQLIQAVRDVIDTTDTALGTGTGGSGTSFNQSFATVEGEKPSLPNSRQLVAGTGIQFNDTFTNLVISGSAIPGSDGGEGEEGMMGPPGVQGPQGAIGPTGPSGSGSGSSMPFYFGDGDYNDNYPEMGPPGPRGATGAMGSGSGISMPYYFGDNEDSPELPALFTLMNGNSIPEEAIIDGAILARVGADEVITGQWSFTGAATFFISTNPTVYYMDSDGSADEKWWRWNSNGGALTLETLSDDLLTSNSALAFVRSGVPVQSTIMYTDNTFRTTWNSLGVLTHYYALAMAGQVSYITTGDATAWNPTGLGTAYYISDSPDGLYNIRGILVQPPGTFVTIFQANTNLLTFYHEDGAATASERILIPGSISSISILQYGNITFYYDGIASRWVVLGWN
jgi:hypothetical protein